MAGLVKADVQGGLAGTGRVTVVPRACPCISNANRPRCAELSTVSGWVNLCPFLYGMRALSGGMIADLRDTQTIAAWLSTGNALNRSWEALCLRKESAGLEAGARLRD